MGLRLLFLLSEKKDFIGFWNFEMVSVVIGVNQWKWLYGHVDKEISARVSVMWNMAQLICWFDSPRDKGAA